MATTQIAVAEQWVTKDVAARMLGLGIRAIERIAEKGGLSKRKEPTKKGYRVLYLLGEVEQLKSERAAGIVRASAGEMAPVPQANLAIVNAQTEAWAAMATHMTRLGTLFPALAKAWMTLDEAAEYSGLPIALLEPLLREQTIFALGRGPKTWRIQRASLDAYGRAGHQ